MGAGEIAGEAKRSLCLHVGDGVSQGATSPGQVPQGPLGRCQPVAWSWGECRVVMMIRGGSLLSEYRSHSSNVAPFPPLPVKMLHSPPVAAALKTPEGVSHIVSTPVILTWAVSPARPASHHLQTSPGHRATQGLTEGCCPPHLYLPLSPASLLQPPAGLPDPLISYFIQFILCIFQSNLPDIHIPALPFPRTTGQNSTRPLGCPLPIFPTRKQDSMCQEPAHSTQPPRA